MCGIIAYVGKNNASQTIYEGLKNLEYRGYDSVGIAVKHGDDIRLIKRAGRVNAIEDAVKDLQGRVGIGHTRWATHGKPNDKNAHPHSAGGFYVVHNGIIENYSEIKNELLSEGCSFSSETDSEVIPHLINKYYEGDFLQAVICSVKRLKGSYAICVIYKGFEGVIVACNKSPVILGYSKSGNYVCSDAPAVAESCKNITVLLDGDVAVLREKSVKIYNEKGQIVKREIITNYALKTSLDLGNCPHYMLKELHEVPNAVSNTINSCKSIKMQDICALLKGVDKVVLTGCGTAYHACLVARDWIEETCAITAVAETAGEWRYKSSVVNEKTLVVAVSQSGETADTLEALKKAKSLGAKTVAVTNVGYSAITRVAHFTLPVSAGAEICVAATKSYCGQLISLFFLTLFLKEGENAFNSPMLKFVENLPKLCKIALNSLNIDALCKEIKGAQGVYFIGRGLDCAVAKEGSLKLKEVSLKFSEGYAAGELKHGTLALIDEKTYTIAIVCDKHLCDKTLSAIKQISARGGKVAVVCGVEGFAQRVKDVANYIISIPLCEEYLSPIISVIPLQLIAYKTAVLCGCNPDKPRNLAKSVTVE